MCVGNFFGSTQDAAWEEYRTGSKKGMEMVIYVRFLPDSRAVAAVGHFPGLFAEDFSHALASIAALVLLAHAHNAST